MTEILTAFMFSMAVAIVAGSMTVVIFLGLCRIAEGLEEREYWNIILGLLMVSFPMAVVITALSFYSGKGV